MLKQVCRTVLALFAGVVFLAGCTASQPQASSVADPGALAGLDYVEEIEFPGGTCRVNLVDDSADNGDGETRTVWVRMAISLDADGGDAPAILKEQGELLAADGNSYACGLTGWMSDEGYYNMYFSVPLDTPLEDLAFVYDGQALALT